MNKKIILILGLAFTLLIPSVYADELIVDFEEGSVPVLNEELRKTRGDTNRLKDDIDTNEADIDTLEALSVKGWINLNGTGTIAINDSLNVSGIADDAVGKYTITWDTDFANNDYAWSGSAPSVAGQPLTVYNEAQAAGTLQIGVKDTNNVYKDVDNICVIAFGEQ